MMAAEQRVQVQVRMPVTLQLKISGYWMKLRKAAPGMSVSKNDAIVTLLMAGLEAEARKRRGDA